MPADRYRVASGRLRSQAARKTFMRRVGLASGLAGGVPDRTAPM
jgi:hypothetical protein